MKWIRRLVVAFVAWRTLGPIVAPKFRPPQEHPFRSPGKTVFVGDQEFLVRVLGPEGAKPVVLIHGLAGSSLAEWYRIGPALAEKYKVIMVDHRSHGLSPLARDRFEIEDVADDVAGVLDRLDIGMVSAVGYSMGGAVAQALAYRHPGRVDRIVLIATFAHHPKAWRIARSIGAVLARGWERLTGLGTPEVRSAYLLATRSVAEKHARWLWEETHRRDIEAGAQASLATFRFDSRAWVGRIPAAAKVIISTADQLVPPSWQYELAALLHDVQVVELAGARHEAPWSHADRISDEIADFFG